MYADNAGVREVSTEMGSEDGIDSELRSGGAEVNSVWTHTSGQKSNSVAILFPKFVSNQFSSTDIVLMRGVI